MTIVKTKDISQFGNTYITSVGNITFDEKGYLEIDDNKAQELVNHDPRLSIFDERDEEAKKKSDEDDEVNTYKKELLKKKAIDLQDMCEKLELPKEEWELLKKNELIDYLISKAV